MLTVKTRKTKKILDEVITHTSKKGVQIKESSYETGGMTGGKPETSSPYEFARDTVPTLNRIEELKNKTKENQTPENLPFPMQDTVRELADLYLKAQDIRNKARDAAVLPFFKGREAKLEHFRKKLNGIMVECKNLAAELKAFSLAPR